MRKSTLQVVRALIVVGLLIAPQSFARPNQQIQETVPAEISVLAEIPSDTEDPVVSLGIVGQEGVIIRSQSMWYSRDGGRTWTLSAKPTHGSGPASFEMAWLEGPAHAFAIADNFVFETTDAGRVWTKTGLIGHPAGEFLAIAGDRGAGWMIAAGSRSVPQSRESAISLPKYAEDRSSSSRFPRMLVPEIVTSGDGGRTWKPALLPKAIGPLDKIIVSGSSAIALGPYLVVATTDGGKSWHLMEESNQAEEEAYPISAAILGNQAWVSLKNGSLLTGEIGKRELTLVSKSSSALDALIFMDPCRGFTIMNDKLARTEDGGVTWQQLTHSGGVEAIGATRSTIIAATHDQILNIESQPARSLNGCAKPTR